MKEIVEDKFGKLSVVFQQSIKTDYLEVKKQFLKIKKVESDKVLSPQFYKPISRFL